MRIRSVARGRSLSFAARSTAQSIELLEGRRLLSGLLDMRGQAAQLVDAPGDGGINGGLVANRVDADRSYLANALALSDIAKVEKLSSPLQTLLSREVRNGAARLAGVGAETINGTRYDRIYNVENGLPHMDLWVNSVTAALPLVKALGMVVSSTYAQDAWQLIGGFIAPDKLLDLARLPGLRYAAPSEIATPDGASPTIETGGGSAHGGGGDSQGTVVNQWEAQTRADVFKAILAADNGSGINVGVISDSVNRVGTGIAASQGTNNLPATVNNLQDAASGVDEGRAMLELIYDVANGAGLYFHSSYGVSGHAAAYNTLKANGVDVIADDIPNFSEPVFQQGPISQAAENAYATNDVLVFGSAGNRNNEGYADTWANADADRFHEFFGADETLEFTIAGSGDQTIYLHWNQPWGSATTDLDIRVYNRNADGTVGSLAFESNQNNVGGNSLETLSFTNPSGSSRSYHLSIVVESGAASGAAAAGLQLQMYLPDSDNDITYINTYTTNSPAINPNRNSDNTFVIGAVPTTNLSTIESFSSRGPITRYFTDAGVAYGTPITRNVPQYHAADGTATSVPGFGNFFGTSAAAPNAAAVAALVLDAAGSLGAGDLTFSQLFNIFQDTAVGTSAGGAWNAAYGQGRIDALGAGFAAKGNTLNEYALELNQFGDATLSAALANLFGQTDIDGIFWSTDISGNTVVNGTAITAALNPAMALYRKGVAGYPGFEQFNDDGGVGNAAQISRSLTAWTQYTAELFNQTLNAVASDYTFTVNGPTAVITALSLDANGDFNSATQNLGADGDADYYNVVVPETSNGSVTITVTPGTATLDSVITLFTNAGVQVSRVDGTNANGVETMTLTGLTPGSTYNIRVGGYSYASSGDFTLDVNFQTFLPVTLTTAEGYAVFNHLGVSANVSDINVFMDSAVDIDSVYFAGDTNWNGTYTVSVTGASGVTPALAIYDSATGTLLGSNLNAANAATTSVSITGTDLTRYIFAVAATNGVVGDITFNITAPSTGFLGSPVALDVFGDGVNSSNTITPAADIDFFNFTVPANATTGTLRLANEVAGTDGVIALFDSGGTFISRVDNAAAGGVDTLSMVGLTPGATYRITIMTQDYATAGAYTLQVDLNVLTGAVAGTKYHDLNADGSRAGTEPGLPGWQIFADLNNNGILDAAANYAVEPDNYSPGLNISAVDSHVSLSAIGSSVTSANVYSRTNTFSSTGDQVFGYDGAFDPAWVAGGEELKITFAIPAYSVSIDAISNDVLDIGSLRIYNAANVLLATYTTANLASGVFEKMTLTRTQGDIAYAIATGSGGEDVELDNLAFSFAEPSVNTNASGDYTISGVPVGAQVIREVQQATWVASQGASGNNVVVTNGGTVAGVLFGNFHYANIGGHTYNDINRNSIFDGPDAVLSGVRVYVDVNNDGAWQATEPNDVTNGAGAYSILNVTPGTYKLREVVPSNWDVVLPTAGFHTITPSSGDSLVRDYLNRRQADFGDAPAPYATLYAANGAYHWFDSTLYMGTKVDAEVDGQPNVTATGDDNVNSSDEDGVQFLDPILPGANTRIRITTSAAGRLNGWIDLNRDGDWFDAIDSVIGNVAVPAAGTYVFNVPIPVIAGLGVSFARFRFNVAGGIGPEGFGDAGEVEDYRLVIGDNTPPAVVTSSVEYQAFQGITILFSEQLNPASVQPGDLIAQNLTTPANFVPSSVIIAPSNDKVTFVFSPGVVLTDGLYNFRLGAGSVTDSSGNALAAQYDYAGADAFFLSGDCNRDRQVNFDDLLIVAQNYNLSPRTFSTGNVNYSADGLVNFDDLLILAQQYTHSLFSSQPISHGHSSGSVSEDVLEM